MMKKQMKSARGITLIALVVTIIVLLMLAAISIGVLTGDNGIIKQSQQAKEETEISEEKEILNISVVQATEEDVYGNLEEEPFREKLNNNAEGTELEKIGDNYKVTFPSDREYIVTGDGEINQIDKENTVELIAKLSYENSNKEYRIGVGVADYQLPTDYLKPILNFFRKKTDEEKDKLFLDMLNEQSGNNYTSIEEAFKSQYEEGLINKPITSLEDYIKNMLESQGIDIDTADIDIETIKATFLILIWEIGKMETGNTIDELENYLKTFAISGTLITPNGNQAKLVVDFNSMTNTNESILKSYYQYPINQNGEYTFIFYGDDGSYGEVTLKVDEETPQIVTSYPNNESMMIMLGLDNWVDMQEVSIELLNEDSIILANGKKETIDLTPYLTTNVSGFYQNEKGICFYEVPDIDKTKENFGEITCKYNEQEIKTKISIAKPAS